MTLKQKEEIEHAVSLRGVCLSQWSLESLLANVRKVIARSSHTVMAPVDFDAFVEALDAPMNPALKKSVSQKAMQER